MATADKYRPQKRQGAETPAEPPVDPFTGILQAAAEQALANPDEEDHASLRDLLVGAFRQEIQKLQDTPVKHRKFQGGWLGAFQKPTDFEKQSERVGQLSALLSNSGKVLDTEAAKENQGLLLDMVNKAYPDDPAKRAKLFRGLSPGKTKEDERFSKVTLPLELQRAMVEEFPDLMKAKGKSGESLQEWLAKQEIGSQIRERDALKREARSAKQRDEEDLTKRRRDFHPAVTPSPAITRHLGSLVNSEMIPYGDQEMWSKALSRANRNAITNRSVLSIIGETNPAMLKDIEDKGIRPDMVDQVLSGPLSDEDYKTVHRAKVNAIFSELGIGTVESHLSDLTREAIAAIDGEKGGLSLKEIIDSADWTGGHKLTASEKKDLEARVRDSLKWARSTTLTNSEFPEVYVLEILADPTASQKEIQKRVRKKFGMFPVE